MYKLTFVLYLLLNLLPWPAHALFNNNSASIKEGLFNIESRNRWDEDDRASKNSFQAHSLKFDYGLSKYATIEMQNLWQDVGKKHNKYVSTEFETKLRFYDPNAYWLDAALKFGYEFRHDSNRADQLKTKLLVQKDFPDFFHLLNLNLSKEVGADTRKDVELSLGWRTKYKLSPYFEPGFEYFANYGELVDMRALKNQPHRIGPMFFGEILPGVKYQAGYLLGLTDAAEDGSFKFFLRYEFPL
jgi:hypothetical protein